MAFLTNHFALRDRTPDAERLRQQKWFIKARKDHQKQKELEDARAEDFVDLAAGVIIATETDIEAFHAKLDNYDTATVRALELNRLHIDEITEQLLDVRARIQDKLDRAYVMEDGRRAFLTENRSQAFDEHGTEVTNDELDFDLVDSSNPSWESYLGDVEQKDQLEKSLGDLETERADILEFQEKLDEARERSNTGDFTKDELDELDADLESSVPNAIARQLPGYQSATLTPDVSAVFKTSANPVAAPSAKKAATTFQPDTM